MEEAQRSKYKYKYMSVSEEEQQYTFSEQSLAAEFAHLRPVEEEKPSKIRRIPGGLSWLKNNDKENKKNKKQNAVKNGRKEARDSRETRQRSRSRSRSRDRRRPDSITMREANGEEDKNYIEISDDEGDAELLDRYYKIGNQYYLKDGFESMNWRERRRLQRLFAREQRKYVEGKQKDQLSFKVFNTIEEYFR